MTNLAAPVLLALVIAVGGGIWSADAVSRGFGGFGALSIGPWTAFPRTGTAGSDPYARARLSRSPEIPLGSAEGMLFEATTDSNGQPLSSSCSYRVTGSVPPARLWTLRTHATGNNEDDAQLASTHSREILYEQDGSFAINISTVPQVLNWMRQPLEPGLNFSIKVTLYDTSLSGEGGLTETRMPDIERGNAMIARMFYAIGIGLVGAVIVHLAIIFSAPGRSDLSAWSVIQSSMEKNQPVEISTLSELATHQNHDPAMRSVICRFDLGEGSQIVRSPARSILWSASVHTSTNMIAFSANDRIAPDGTLDFILANPLQVRELAQDATEASEDSVVVPLDNDEGFVIVRVFEPDQSWKPVNDRFFDAMECGAV